MKTVIIVQARMTSTRLPGKVLQTVLGKPLLEYQIERLQRVRLANQVVIATTTNRADQPIVDLADRLAICYFRGSEPDVLSRYYEAACLYQADTIVRITSDCPLIDPTVVDRVIQFYQEHHPHLDYVSNCLQRSYPRGLDTEVFSFTALAEAFALAQTTAQREHVTPFFYQQPDRYRLATIQSPTDQSHHRWTVDTREDFELIRRILAALYPHQPTFGWQEVLQLLDRHPDWVRLNAHVEQKVV